MRRIVAFDNVSADGRFSDEDGSLDWVVQDPEVMRAGASATGGFDTILFGRRTYEMFSAFWPHVGPDTPAPHGGGAMPPEMLAMARMLNESTKLVYSRTMKTATWRNSRIVPRFDPEEIAARKRGAGKDMIVFGSGSIVTQLCEHQLLDELQLVVSPVLLGNGPSLLGRLPETTRLSLREAKAHPSGVVTMRYGVGK